MTMGIYEIRTPGGRCYAGQGINIERRSGAHKQKLVNGTH
jgi:hypothetical protein